MKPLYFLAAVVIGAIVLGLSLPAKAQALPDWAELTVNFSFAQDSTGTLDDQQIIVVYAGSAANIASCLAIATDGSPENARMTAAVSEVMQATEAIEWPGSTFTFRCDAVQTQPVTLFQQSGPTALPPSP